VCVCVCVRVIRRLLLSCSVRAFFLSFPLSFMCAYATAWWPVTQKNYISFSCFVPQVPLPRALFSLLPPIDIPGQSLPWNEPLFPTIFFSDPLFWVLAFLSAHTGASLVESPFYLPFFLCCLFLGWFSRPIFSFFRESTRTSRAGFTLFFLYHGSTYLTISPLIAMVASFNYSCPLFSPLFSSQVSTMHT